MSRWAAVAEPDRYADRRDPSGRFLTSEAERDLREGDDLQEERDQNDG